MQKIESYGGEGHEIRRGPPLYSTNQENENEKNSIISKNGVWNKEDDSSLEEEERVEEGENKTEGKETNDEKEEMCVMEMTEVESKQRRRELEIQIEDTLHQFETRPDND